jgi:ribonucleotide monophosphatase NagD (HAD superfamily)
MTGILVKTGKYRFGDENKINPKPNYVMNSFKDAIDLILKNVK